MAVFRRSKKISKNVLSSALFVSIAWVSTCHVTLALATPSWVTLDSSFQSAVRKSETLSDQDQQVVQAQERIAQARGSFFPNISGSAAYFVQQNPTDPVAQSIFPSSQPTVKLTATQPVFRGLRDFATLSQLGRHREAAEFAKEQALVQLYKDVLQNFFNILSLEQELKNLETQIGLYADRINDLHLRTRTGESSASDALSAQATQAGVKAQAKRIQGQIKAAREAYTYLTGLPQDTPLAPIHVGDLPPSLALQEYMNGIEHRPDIRSAKQNLEASEAGVSSAKGGHLPTADLLANYYLIRPVGVFSDIRWDVQATLTLPIFSGGVTQSQVAEAASKRMQAELALSKARRLAEQEIRSVYETYQTDLEEVSALQLAMTLAEKNYQVLKRDYARGLTRNIDVLSALTQFQESKRALDRSRLNAQADHLRLGVISTQQALPQL